MHDEAYLQPLLALDPQGLNGRASAPCCTRPDFVQNTLRPCAPAPLMPPKFNAQTYIQKLIHDYERT